MKNTRNFTLTVTFLTILILLAATPLGFIPISPISATTMHIPVIITSIVLGLRLGAFLGGISGLISMIRSTVTQTSSSFVFSPFIPAIGTEHGSWKVLLIAFISRILIGVVPYFVYKGLCELMKQRVDSVFLSLTGLSGSLTNMILVMNMIYLLFQQDYAKITGTNLDAVYSATLAVIFTSGIPERIVAGLATVAVCNVLLRYFKHLSLTN